MKLRVRLQSVLGALIIIVAWQVLLAKAQDGDYTIEPWSGAYNDVKVQWDQKIVTAGTWFLGTADGGMTVARYNFDGVPDATFGSGGVSSPALVGTSGGAGYGLALQPDGKVIVASRIGDHPAVARFTASGSLDGGFGNSGWNIISSVQGGADKVGLQSTGKIVVSGTSGDPFVARFTANGALDNGKNGFGLVSKGKPLGYAFGPATASFYTGLAVHPDDKLTAIGLSSSALATRYTANGVIDKTFNGSGSLAFKPIGVFRTLGFGAALQPDGKLLIVGDGVWNNRIDTDLFVVRVTSTGALDPTFNGGSGFALLDSGSASYEAGNDVVVQPDGRIVVAGRIRHTASDESNKVLVACLNSNGTLDSTFGVNGFKVGGPLDSKGLAVDLQLDGSIIVAGSAIVDENGVDVTHPLLMRFDP